MAENLASKYRPKDLDSIVEQPVVVATVKNIVKSKKMSNRNFLFIGSQGVGKTTTARALASALNEGKGEPIELDAASHSGVDAMRSIIDQARSYPIGSTYKVFIIDEVHALSPAAWQSLLKTLEEQPARSVFMLATTNAEKIPATIISRVQTFQLSRISLQGIHDRLKYIIEQENKEGRQITYSDEAVMYIAKFAKGGMRDGITALDQ